MITLVGVGHVFSIKEAVKHIIMEKAPKAVCVELDRMRFDALRSGALHDPNAPFIMKRLQKIYENAASSQGASIGEEMLAGVEAAEELSIPYFLIDVDASKLMMSIIEKMTMSQKLKIAGQVLTASVLPKDYLEDGIQKVQERPEEAMALFEKEYPDIKRDIVDNRDEQMSERIKVISKDYHDLVVLVGEGHIPGMMKILSNMDLEVIHLSEVMKIAKSLADGSLSTPKKDPIKENRTHTVSFSYTIEMNDEEII